MKRGKSTSGWSGPGIWVAVVCLCGTIFPAAADIVHLANGDRMSGQIQSLDNKELVLTSEVLGEVSLPRESVETFSTDDPVRLHLSDGSVIEQKVKSGQADKIVIGGTGVLQEQAINLSDLEAISAPDEAKPPEVNEGEELEKEVVEKAEEKKAEAEEAVEAKAEETAEKAEALTPLEQEKRRAPWKGDIGLGFTATRGNSDTNTGNFDLGLKRRRPDDRLGFEANYIFSEEKSDDEEDYDTVTDRGHVAGKYDYFFTQKLYGFGQGRVGRDQVAELDSRVLLNTGLGYQWAESDDFSFLTEAGLGWQVEDFEAADQDTSSASGRAAYDLSKKLLEWLRFNHNTEYYPLLDDFANYFLTTKAELRAYYTEQIYSNFQVRMDYESDPPPGRESTDVFYILGAGVEF